MTARIKRCAWYLIVGFVLIMGWVVAHLYYYNMLVDMEYNIQEAWAQVETQRQRRFHIQQNLTRLVIEYARHERSVLTNLTMLRTGKNAEELKQTTKKPRTANNKAAAPLRPEDLKVPLEKMSPKQLDELFPRIQFMAEQYPKLRLTENFQQFSTAVIDTESQIAKQLSLYNKAVNDFTTILMQFPGNIFGRACGFEPYKFYIPDKKSITYTPVEYKIDG
jgi:LemA protein